MKSVRSAIGLTMAGVMAGGISLAASPAVDLSGFKVAVLATDGFEQPELEEPVKALKEAHATVEIVSINEGDIQGLKHMDKGDSVHADNILVRIKPEDYDGLMLPGGAMNADKMRVVPEAKNLVVEFDRSHKPIAAICHAPWLLVSAGLVKGRTLTSYHTIQDDITNAGGIWKDEEVVKDRNWVTSRQPDDLPKFNKAMLELFAAAKAKKAKASKV